MKIGLVGNPNVGKSLIFHQLTGLGVEVSNYPGTTIDLQSGNTCFGKERVEIADLPGIYSLDGDSDEEQIVRSFVSSGRAEALVVVLDAVPLERNLYLLLQLAEYRLPLLVVLNMMDEAEKAGIASGYCETLHYPWPGGPPYYCHPGEEYRQDHPGHAHISPDLFGERSL